MGLKPCKECGKEVSTSAKQCPNCGRKYPTGGLTLPAKLFLPLIALIVIGQIIGRSGGRAAVSSVNSAPPTPQMTVSALQLFQDYQANEVAADNRYKGRVLSVTGDVDGINRDILDKTYLTLQTSNMFMTVHAQLQPTEVAQAASIRKGQHVRLVCTGKGMIMGSPMLDDCRFQ